MKKKLIILDRDGVINVDSPDYIKSPQEWLPIPGSLEAIAMLNARGYTVVIATNQSGIARGYYDEHTLTQIHQKMHDCLASLLGKVDRIFYCPHGPDENCPCRKPKPGLLEQIANTYNTSLSHVPFIGDSLRDITAALNAGAAPILVLTGNGKKTQNKLVAHETPIPRYEDLFAFAQDDSYFDKLQNI
jgi:D-glycero-D-manno-heptose 1,7-bisphosphate phosphatase